MGNYLRAKVDAAAGLPPFITWYPKAQILSLPLKDSCLVLFIIEYGYANQVDIPVESISGKLMATCIQIYSTASLASNRDLVLLKEADINGYLHDAFSLAPTFTSLLFHQSMELVCMSLSTNINKSILISALENMRHLQPYLPKRNSFPLLLTVLSVNCASEAMAM